jgi:hypothetical protein
MMTRDERREKGKRMKNGTVEVTKACLWTQPAPSKDGCLVEGAGTPGTLRDVTSFPMGTFLPTGRNVSRGGAAMERETKRAAIDY